MPEPMISHSSTPNPGDRTLAHSGYLGGILYILKWGSKLHYLHVLPFPTKHPVGRLFLASGSHVTQLENTESRAGSQTVGTASFSLLASSSHPRCRRKRFLCSHCRGGSVRCRPPDFLVGSGHPAATAAAPAPCALQGAPPPCLRRCRRRMRTSWPPSSPGRSRPMSWKPSSGDSRRHPTRGGVVDY
jgi:hypothetical protein